ncbi:hypothetical protein CY652_22760 [Burkholderia sp. WAC0059]|uniref:hypothetical protein n=1 Tax=Burkholderia sp. WAC0059 TaxID=2066022 RepID=UPI000C7F0280|nr:hypothetical protein [Burkholderia sp. WAC0059]PLZ00110.1 hypothetical protein CY652_22760 [Burkholderia sp. WAC0059]
MNDEPSLPTGTLASSLIDDDIAHIRRVMPPSLHGDLGGPILPAAYWRRRLHTLLESAHVNKTQLCEIDGLLRQVDEFDRQSDARRDPPGSSCGSKSGAN